MGLVAGIRSKQRQRAHAVRVRWAPSRLRRIVRHPALWWLLAVCLAVGGGASLLQRIDDLDGAIAGWGETRAVAVITRPVAVGESVSGAIEVRELPVALVGESAVSSVGDNAFARVELHAGEVLLAERLSSSDAGGLPADTAALTVTLAQQSPLVGIGDLVDLWTVDTALGRSDRVATRVVVLAQSDNALTVAVPHADVGNVALAAVRPLTAALVG